MLDFFLILKPGAEAVKNATKFEPKKPDKSAVEQSLNFETVKVSERLDKSGGSGKIELRDNGSIYKPVTESSITNVPFLKIFDDDNLNIKHQQASKELLQEVMKHKELPVGTEFSIIYDSNMNRLPNHEYVQGMVGKTKIDCHNKPLVLMTFGDL